MSWRIQCPSLFDTRASVYKFSGFINVRYIRGCCLQTHHLLILLWSSWCFFFWWWLGFVSLFFVGQHSTSMFLECLMLCLHILTCSFPHKGAVSLLCPPHLLFFFHTQFSYYFYYDSFFEFPRWNHSRSSKDALLLTTVEHLSSYCIIISVHVFFPSLGSNLLEAEVLSILYSQQVAQLCIYS